MPGDRDELIRVFENLVENALKYAASGKRVDIALSVGEGPDGKREARIAVRDRGPGIAPEHLPRLTERFYRVDVSESRAQGGTGLGLALVKHILNRHGGRLTIESALGQGATFTVHLPMAATPRPAEIQLVHKSLGCGEAGTFVRQRRSASSLTTLSRDVAFLRLAMMGALSWGMGKTARQRRSAPSPIVGEGRGGERSVSRAVRQSDTPTPTPPHKGEGSTPSAVGFTPLRAGPSK